jgi:hypothetical protein
MPDPVRLALAGYDFQAIAQRNQPALAAYCFHLTHVVYIDNRIAVDSFELRAVDPFLKSPQRVGGEIALSLGNNPHKFTFRL